MSEYVPCKFVPHVVLALENGGKLQVASGTRHLFESVSSKQIGVFCAVVAMSVVESRAFFRPGARASGVCTHCSCPDRLFRTSKKT